MYGASSACVRSFVLLGYHSYFCPVFSPCLQIGIYKALLDIASGLDYLHAMGVVHGDLKTANVLLKGSAKDARGFVCKLADFGLSRVLDMDATHVSTK